MDKLKAIFTDKKTMKACAITFIIGGLYATKKMTGLDGMLTEEQWTDIMGGAQLGAIAVIGATLRAAITKVFNQVLSGK